MIIQSVLLIVLVFDLLCYVDMVLCMEKIVQLFGYHLMLLSSFFFEVLRLRKIDKKCLNPQSKERGDFDKKLVGLKTYKGKKQLVEINGFWKI